MGLPTTPIWYTPDLLHRVPVSPAPLFIAVAVGRCFFQLCFQLLNLFLVTNPLSSQAGQLLHQSVVLSALEKDWAVRGQFRGKQLLPSYLTLQGGVYRP